MEKYFSKIKQKWEGVPYDVGHPSVQKKNLNGVPGLVAAFFTKVKEHSVNKIPITYGKNFYGKTKIIWWGSLCH
jgi:hypothetical protein